MKKKVLFALIALLSFVSAWAEGETIVNTDGTAGYVVLPATGGFAPTTLAVKIGTETKVGTAAYAADGVTAVNGNITEMGNYFLKVDDSGALYAFQVARKLTADEYELIDNEDAYNTSKASRVLKLYYEWADNGGSKPYKEDLWNTVEGRPAGWADWGVAANQEKDANGYYQYPNCERNWYGALTNPVSEAQQEAGYKSGWPFVGFNFSDDNSGKSYKIVLKYEDAETTPALFIEKPLSIVFGNGTDLKAWAVVNLPQTFEKPEWSIGIGTFNQGNYQGDDNNSYLTEFKKAKLSVLLLPGEAPNENILRDYAWTMTPTVVAYNAQAQAPTITVTAKDLSGQTVTVPQFNETDNSINWIPRYFTTGENPEEVDEMINKGVYDVFVYLPDADEPIGEAKQFEITAFQLTLGASVSYKQLGDPDPAPAYSLLYDNAPESVKAEAAKLKITGLKLTRSYPDTDTEDKDYVGKQIRCFIEMIDAAVQDEDGQPNANYQVGTSSVDTWLVITQKLLREGEFRVVILDDIFTYDGTAKTLTNIKVQQDMNYGKDGDPDFKDVLPSEVLGTVADNFEITYANNTAADAYGTPRLQGNENVYDWMTNIEPAKRATVILTPKATGNYTSRLNLGNNEFEDGVENIQEAFKIKQANIAGAAVTLTIPEGGLIFNNEAQKPAVTVKYNNNTLTLVGAEAGAAAVDNQDYVFSYSGNTYVDDNAKATVEAVYTGSGAEKVYTGNYFGTKDASFTISKFVFTLKPKDHIVAVGDAEEDYDATDGFEVIGVPAASMGEGATMPQAVSVIAEWTKPVNRIAGTGVGVYTILLKGAKLKTEQLVGGTPKSAPSNNYEMTAENGTYEITKAEGVFFVSSKKIEKVYDGETTFTSTATPGYYLYKKTGTGNRKQDYTEILPESNLFKMIVGPTQHTARPMAQGENFNSDGDRVPGRDVRSNPAYSWWIMPVVDDLSTDDYTLQVMPRLYDGNYQGGNNYNQHEGEGFCQISARNVVLVADNQESEFNEAIVTPLTATAYDRSTDANADANGLKKDADGNIQNTPLSATLAAQIAYALEVRNGGSNWNPRYLQQGDPVGEYTISFAQNQPAVSSNFNVTRVNGVYKIIESTKRIKLTATGTKVFGEADADATWTVTAVLGKGEEFAEYTGQLPTVLNAATSYKRASTTDTDESAGSTHDMDFVQKTGAAPNETVVCPAKINGYIVDYDNSTAVLTINKAGELILTAANQFIEYGMLPQVGENVSAPYLKINGHKNDLDKIKATVVITYPESGLIKKGATINITYDEAYVNANYTSVTVKTGKLNIIEVDEITLNRVAKDDADPIATSYADIVKDNAPKNNAQQLIADYDQLEGIKVSFDGNVAMVAEKWYAMVLPFDVTVKEVSDAFGYAVVETLDKNSNDIHFKIQMQSIPANTPFIVKIYDAKKLNDVKFTNKTIVYAAAEDIVAFNKDESAAFYGTYVGKTGFTGKEYFFPMSTSADPEKYYYGSDTNTTFLRPLGSYIKDLSDALAGARNIYIDEVDGTTTAIGGVAVAEDADASVEGSFAEGWYTITGVKLTAEPTVSGTYIYNGKKVYFQAK